MSESKSPERLKLRAVDAEDVQVMACILQDAIVPVCDMTYRAQEKCFVMVVQRFMWDCLQIREIPANDPDPGHAYERINSALDIEGVEGVQFMGLNPNDPASMLDLLTITYENGCLDFVFAGGGKLRLKLGKWQARMHDFGESWPTTHCPCHAGLT